MYIWTCDELACNDCNNGSGVICSAYSVTVTDRVKSGPRPSKPGCKSGNMVRIVRHDNKQWLNFYELAAGSIKFCKESVISKKHANLGNLFSAVYT